MKGIHIDKRLCYYGKDTKKKSIIQKRKKKNEESTYYRYNALSVDYYDAG